MGFYEQISKYYDYIFPVDSGSLGFISQSAGDPGQKILDVACGSGGYALELAKQGYKVTAVDVEKRMVDMAEEKAKEANVRIAAKECDMLELANCVDAGYDCIFCIGNSLVHLGSINEITEALRQMYRILGNTGSLVLQIINYDRIIKYSVSELPTIKNESIGLEFVRKYRYKPDNGKISFDTSLTIGHGADKEEYTNSIELFPILSTQMEAALKEAGFSKFKFYGDFKYSEYTENSYMMVIIAEI